MSPWWLFVKSGMSGRPKRQHRDSGDMELHSLALVLPSPEVSLVSCFGGSRRTNVTLCPSCSVNWAMTPRLRE